MTGWILARKQGLERSELVLLFRVMAARERERGVLFFGGPQPPLFGWLATLFTGSPGRLI